jgi:hypothetical protein
MKNPSGLREKYASIDAKSSATYGMVARPATAALGESGDNTNSAATTMAMRCSSANTIRHSLNSSTAAAAKDSIPITTATSADTPKSMPGTAVSSTSSGAVLPDEAASAACTLYTPCSTSVRA